MAVFVAAIVFRIVVRGQVSEEAAYFLTPSRMDAFAAGAFVALLPMADLQRYARYAAPLAGAAALAIAIMFVAMRGLHPHDLPVQTAGFSCIAVIFAAALVAIRAERVPTVLREALSSRPLTFFGKYSYAMYVFHIQIIVAVNRLLVDADIQPETIAGFEAPPRLLYAAILTALTAGAAVLSWYLYERHFLRLKDRFRSRAPGASGTAHITMD